jgi:hypothetical protein
MSGTDALMKVLRSLPPMDVPPDRSLTILASARAALPTKKPKATLLHIVGSRVLAPALVYSTVAAYLVWAVTVATALYP